MCESGERGTPPEVVPFEELSPLDVPAPEVRFPEKALTSENAAVPASARSLGERPAVTLDDRRDWGREELARALEVVDFVRECIAKAEAEIIELDVPAARRAAKATYGAAGTDNRAAMADLRREIERQKQTMAELRCLVQQTVEETPRRGFGGGLDLWSTLIILVLVAAVAVAGILLPREAEPGARFLVEMATMYQAAGKTEEAARVLDEAVEKGDP